MHRHSHLPTCSSIFVIWEVSGYPVIYVTESHPLLRGTVDGKRNEGCIGIRWLSVVTTVSLGLQGVQSSRQVDGARRWFSGGRSCSGRLSRRFHLSSRPSSQVWEPVYGSQTVSKFHTLSLLWNALLRSVSGTYTTFKYVGILQLVLLVRQLGKGWGCTEQV